jgi:hypothetical protein
MSVAVQHRCGFACGSTSCFSWRDLRFPSMSVAVQHRCGIEAAHQGPHHAHVQTDEGFLPDGAGQRWWITWTKGCRCLQPLAGCEMTAPAPLGRAREGECLLAQHHPGGHSYELRSAASAVASRAASRPLDGSSELGAPLQRRIASQGATPTQVARALTQLLGSRRITAAELDTLTMAEALVLDVRPQMDTPRRCACCVLPVSAPSEPAPRRSTPSKISSSPRSATCVNTSPA